MWPSGARPAERGENMEKKLAVKLDKCLELAYRDEPVEECPDGDDDDDHRVEKLLEVASSLADMPRVEPLQGSRETAQERPMARLGQESTRVKAAELNQPATVVDNLSSFGDRLRQSITGHFRLVITITLIVLVAVVMALTSSNLRRVPAAGPATHAAATTPPATGPQPGYENRQVGNSFDGDDSSGLLDGRSDTLDGLTH
jgi:hypothetical protein